MKIYATNNRVKITFTGKQDIISYRDKLEQIKILAEIKFENYLDATAHEIQHKNSKKLIYKFLPKKYNEYEYVRNKYKRSMFEVFGYKLEYSDLDFMPILYGFFPIDGYINKLNDYLEIYNENSMSECLCALTMYEVTYSNFANVYKESVWYYASDLSY